MFILQLKLWKKNLIRDFKMKNKQMGISMECGPRLQKFSSILIFISNVVLLRYTVHKKCFFFMGEVMLSF